METNVPTEYSQNKVRNLVEMMAYLPGWVRKINDVAKTIQTEDLSFEQKCEFADKIYLFSYIRLFSDYCLQAFEDLDKAVEMLVLKEAVELDEYIANTAKNMKQDNT